jgi:CAAX prenyl protease-like protein
LPSGSSTPKSSHPVLARAAPFAAFIVFLAAFPQLPLLRGLVVAALLAFFWRHYAELRTARLSTRQALIAIGIGALVFGAWIALDEPWARLGDGSPGYAPLAPDGSIDWARALPRLAILALLVPVMEELFWRSFLLRWIDARDFLGMDARKASRTALLATSGLFALEHSLWLAGLIAGLAYAGLYMTTNNLRAPVLAHAVTNGILGLWILSTGSWHLW